MVSTIIDIQPSAVKRVIEVDRDVGLSCDRSNLTIGKLETKQLITYPPPNIKDLHSFFSIFIYLTHVIYMKLLTLQLL